VKINDKLSPRPGRAKKEEEVAAAVVADPEEKQEEEAKEEVKEEAKAEEAPVSRVSRTSTARSSNRTRALTPPSKNSRAAPPPSRKVPENLSCPSCKAEQTAGYVFCDECGEKAPEQPAGAAKRKATVREMIAEKAKANAAGESREEEPIKSPGRSVIEKNSALANKLEGILAVGGSPGGSPGMAPRKVTPEAVDETEAETGAYTEEGLLRSSGKSKATLRQKKRPPARTKKVQEGEGEEEEEEGECENGEEQ
jgi:hypothetical protein